MDARIEHFLKATPVGKAALEYQRQVEAMQPARYTTAERDKRDRLLGTTLLGRSILHQEAQESAAAVKDA